jgi:hypothetical protein
MNIDDILDFKSKKSSFFWTKTLDFWVVFWVDHSFEDLKVLYSASVVKGSVTHFCREVLYDTHLEKQDWSNFPKNVLWF